MFSKLTSHLARMFALDAAALFLIALFLLFLVQCLRSFELISVKGQGLVTLIGQALLTVPTLAIIFMYVCLGIGLGRGLRALQNSLELHIIHVSRTVSAVMGAVLLYTGGGALAVLILTNFVEPTTLRQLNEWSATISADLVGQALKPHKFTEVVKGVTMAIGSRAPGGELGDFFADDARDPDTRRTYLAESATVAADSEGYVLQLRNGSVQYLRSDGEYSRVSFARYDLAMENLTGPVRQRDRYAEINSLDLVVTAVTTGNWDAGTVKHLGLRFAEAIRVIGICLLVAGMAAFPSGKRRRRGLPLELTVLIAAFFERGVSSNVLQTSLFPVLGSFILGAVGIIVLLIRFRVFAPVRAIRREWVA